MTAPRFADHFAAAAAQVAEAARLAADAAAASAAGQINLAVGTALPVQQLLADALAVYAAVNVLHRAVPPTRPE